MRSIPLVLSAAALLAGGAIHAAPAASMIVVRGARIRPPPPGAPTAAGYATITNAAREPNRLLGGTSPAAARVEIHEMSMTGGIMRMRQITGGVPIGPGQTFRLVEGGDHLMFVNPTHPLKAGDRVPVLLRFQHGRPMPVTFTVGR